MEVRTRDGDTVEVTKFRDGPDGKKRRPKKWPPRDQTPWGTVGKDFAPAREEMLWVELNTPYGQVRIDYIQARLRETAHQAVERVLDNIDWKGIRKMPHAVPVRMPRGPDLREMMREEGCV